MRFSLKIVKELQILSKEEKRLLDLCKPYSKQEMELHYYLKETFGMYATAKTLTYIMGCGKNYIYENIDFCPHRCIGKNNILLHIDSVIILQRNATFKDRLVKEKIEKRVNEGILKGELSIMKLVSELKEEEE